MNNYIRLDTINTNCHILIKDNCQVCFSYGVAVACWISGKGYYKVNEFFSVTTSKHINLFAREMNSESKITNWQLVDTMKFKQIISENL